MTPETVNYLRSFGHERPIATLRAIHNLAQLEFFQKQHILPTINPNLTIIELGAASLLASFLINESYGCRVIAIDDRSLHNRNEDAFWDTSPDMYFAKTIEYHEGDASGVLERLNADFADVVLSFASQNWHHYRDDFHRRKLTAINRVLHRGGVFAETYDLEDAPPSLGAEDEQNNPMYRLLGFERRRISKYGWIPVTRETAEIFPGKSTTGWKKDQIAVQNGVIISYRKI